jgi:uncharacterized membrane protein
MQLPLEFFIVIAALIGAALGFLGASIFASAHFRRIERRTWAAAERYYRLSESARRESRL